MLAAGRGVRSSVLRLPMYVWGNNGSYFIPLNIATAKQHGKAHYILPGWLTPSLQPVSMLEFRHHYVQFGTAPAVSVCMRRVQPSCFGPALPSVKT